MKPRCTIMAVAFVLLACCFQSVQAGEKQDLPVQEKWHRTFMPGTKITLKAIKTKCFLGENILLDYQIEYNGEGALGVDMVEALGSSDCTVVALDVGGKKAPASTRPPKFFGQGGRPLRRGDAISFAIPLGYFCRLEQPGKYRIRAAGNLQWSDRNVPIADGDPRWAETTIEVAMPDAAQAAKVVEQMLQAKKDPSFWGTNAFGNHASVTRTEDYADFACLRYPVYIPILEKMAAAPDGDSRALLGIAHNPAPAAIEALLRLLKTADKNRTLIAAALCDRLPEPQGLVRPDRRNPIRADDADPELVKPSWRNEFAAPMRRFARQALADDDFKLVRCATYTLEAVGTGEDMPDLVAAVSRLVPMVERKAPPYYAVREACSEAEYAVAAMAARGADPKADPRTPGDIIHFVAALEHRQNFRPAGWETRCRDWVQTETPYVRTFVLSNTPRPLPGALHETYRDAARKVIATTHEENAILVAVRSALELKVPVDELMGLLVDRLDPEERELLFSLHSCLEALLITGTDKYAYKSCRLPEKEQIIAVKARWKQLLQDQGPAIRNGKLFDSTEFGRLMYPDAEDGQ